MKLAIGINIFQNTHRQTIAINALKKLKAKYSNITLYNITFSNEKNIDNEFIHLPLLTRTCKDVIKQSTKNKPFAVDLFNALSSVDSDYFLFCNSDILLSSKLIKSILKQEYETYCVSRHDTYPINDLDNIRPFRIEIAGFDAWGVKRQWWLDNKHLFLDFVYAEHLWDVFFTLQMYNYSNCILCNKEFYIAHEKHEIVWNEHSPEAQHNSALWKQTPYAVNWHTFIYNNLIKRQPPGQFLTPLENEHELEQLFLKIKK